MSLLLKSFLRQPEILPDEFLLSYLLRTASANHYDSFKLFESVIHDQSALYGIKDTLYNPVRPETYKVLSTLCRIPDHDLFQHTIHKYAEIFVPCTEAQENITFMDGASFHLADHETLRRNCRPQLNAVFCPECLKESAYYRLEWHILSTTACLKHNALLVDTCQQCGNSLSISDIVNFRCLKCQFDLRTSKVIGIEQDAMSSTTQKILSSWMGIGEPVNIIPGVSSVTLYRIFTGLKYCIQTKVDWDYLHSFPDYFATKPSQRELAKWVVPNKYLHRLNVTAVKALLDFPNEMYKFWDAYREPNHRTNIALGLGYLYWGWIDKHWIAPEYNFLQNAYNEYLVTRETLLYPTLAKSQRILNNPELKSRFQYITVATAAEELHIHYLTVVRLVRIGKIRSMKVNKGNCDVLVLQEDVKSILLKLANSVNFRTTKKLLGASRPVVLSLFRNGLLESVRGNTENDTSRWSITIESISDLQNSLKSACNKGILNNFKDMKNLSEITQQLAGWGVDGAMVLIRVIDGKTKAYLEDGKSVLLTSLYFPANTSNLIKDEIVGSNQWTSLIEFSKSLNVNSNTVNRWINNGLIKPVELIKKSAYFSTKSVDEFKRRYITSIETANILGVGVLTVQKWARFGRLKPVSGAKIDGCHDYRFDRLDIESMGCKKRLTAPQMAKLLGISRSQMCAWIHQGKITPISGPGIDGTGQYMFVDHK
jgi:excisionase family DNA binding protein